MTKKRKAFWETFHNNPYEIRELRDIIDDYKNHFEMLERAKILTYNQLSNRYRTNKNMVVYWYRFHNSEFLMENYRDDKDVVMEAVKSNWALISMVSSRLRNDSDVMLRCIGSSYGNNIVMKYVSNELKSDIKFVKKVIKKYGHLIIYTSENFRRNKELILMALRHSNVFSYKIIKDVYPFGGSDLEIVMEAVKRSSVSMKYVSKDLIKNKKVKEICNKRIIFNKLKNRLKDW